MGEDWGSEVSSDTSSSTSIGTLKRQQFPRDFIPSVKHFCLSDQTIPDIILPITSVERVINITLGTFHIFVFHYIDSLIGRQVDHDHLHMKIEQETD